MGNDFSHSSNGIENSNTVVHNALNENVDNGTNRNLEK